MGDYSDERRLWAKRMVAKAEIAVTCADDLVVSLESDQDFAQKQTAYARGRLVAARMTLRMAEERLEQMAEEDSG